MSYASTDDAIKYTGRGDKIFSSSSPVSPEDIQKIVDDVSAEIDGVLYTLDVPLPITSSSAPLTFKFLTKLNAIGAAAFIELRLFGEASAASVRTTRWRALLDEYHRLLIGLQEQGLGIVEAAVFVDDSALVSLTSLRDKDTRQIKEPFFKRKDVY